MGETQLHGDDMCKGSDAFAHTADSAAAIAEIQRVCAMNATIMEARNAAVSAGVTADGAANMHARGEISKSSPSLS